jgi:hypothetical protein
MTATDPTRTPLKQTATTRSVTVPGRSVTGSRFPADTRDAGSVRLDDDRSVATAGREDGSG